ncbi:MAG: DUF4921 family protein [Pirellulaceae bacterium]
MPEYRQDPVSGSWVIMARERADRPTEFAPQPTHRRGAACPFCRGNELLTPPAVATYPSKVGNGEDAWEVRVIGNKYPAVTRLDGPSVPEEPENMLYPLHPGHGVHEVIIESPDHATSLSELTAQRATWSFLAYRDRLRAVAQVPGIRQGLVFKNCRAAGGATLEHAHSQLLATSVMPPALDRELLSAARYVTAVGDCLFCRILAHERASGQRMLAETEHFAAFCPFASRFPYETWVLPKEHRPDFRQEELENLAELSGLFQRIVRALEKVFAQAPYNFWIHTSPFDMPSHDYYHWHIELISRIGTQAGFEWGSGCFVNPITPEEGARDLREAWER